MPDKAHDSSNTGGPLLTRRGVLGLGVAGLVLASSRQLGAKDSSGAAQVVNRGSVIEFSAAGDGSALLSSFRNAESHFEWGASAAALLPLPAQSSRNTLVLRAKTAAGLEGQLDLTAYPETGAFRWQQSFANT